jgi:hypothetical protein
VAVARFSSVADKRDEFAPFHAPQGNDDTLSRHAGALLKLGRVKGAGLLCREGAESCSLRNSDPTQTMQQHTYTRTAAGMRSRRDTMKTILSALVALSVIASVAGPANALDAKTFFEQVDRDHN